MQHSEEHWNYTVQACDRHVCQGADSQPWQEGQVTEEQHSADKEPALQMYHQALLKACTVALGASSEAHAQAAAETSCER